MFKYNVIVSRPFDVLHVVEAVFDIDRLVFHIGLCLVGCKHLQDLYLSLCVSIGLVNM